MNKEDKIALIKKAIRTQEGWTALGLSVKNAHNPEEAKTECLSLLREISQQKSITLQVSDHETISGSVYDFLVHSLERFL